eukprot:g4386.t1
MNIASLGSKSKKSSGKDSKYFTTTKKGEIRELQEELNSANRDKQRDAVKKVIAAMTVGKDVSMLFPHVVNCMQTGNVELKKLVYLYLMNYAKSNPDLAILAVNTFVKDAGDSNPLIRALAVRTMGCIRVDRITEYLCGPLRKCLQDDDPYVRKTAAICVAKMYDIDPDMVIEQGFVDSLRDLICDSNPTVVANAVAAMNEIAEVSGNRKLFKVTSSILQKLLAALNECNEWGQVFILDSLAQYTPGDEREAEGIIERVTPRLQHANAAVVMSAVKVVMRYMDVIDNSDTARMLSRKLAPPLVTLLSAEPEIQYIALRNIDLIVQRSPQILAHEIKVFFCKYNDPIYVKMEKLEIMIKLASEKNIDQVLLEFKEYATEVDVDFVRKSVRAIGRCAIKLERAAERCINKLLDLIQTKVNYVVQEAVVVIKDIFRKYPNRYESIIATLCDNLDTLDEPEAKASMIWIVGEYADRIENADELLDAFLESFHEEDTVVQLQLLTSTVKLFLKSPDNTQEMMERVLSMATEESDNPDLRDRGYVYWRLLSTDPEAAKAVVLAEKPNISDDTFRLDKDLLNKLISNISTLAAVYHKPPSAFVVSKKGAIGGDADGTDGSDDSDEDDDDDDDDEDDSDDDDDSDGEDDSEEDSDEEDDSDDSDDAGRRRGGKKASSRGKKASAAADTSGDLLDLGGLDLGGSNNNNPAAPSSSGASGGGLEDLFGGSTAPSAPQASLKHLLLSQDKAPFKLSGEFQRESGSDALFLRLQFTNFEASPRSQFALQFNKNSFAMVPKQPQIVLAQPIQGGQSGEYSVPVAFSKANYDAKNLGLVIQAAMKDRTAGGVHYFRIPFELSNVLSSNGGIEKKAFIEKWRSAEPSTRLQFGFQGLKTMDVDSISKILAASNITFIAKRPAEKKVSCYYSCKVIAPPRYLLVELNFPPAGSSINGCKAVVQSAQGDLSKALSQHIMAQLKA